MELDHGHSERVAEKALCIDRKQFASRQNECLQNVELDAAERGWACLPCVRRSKSKRVPIDLQIPATEAS